MLLKVFFSFHKIGDGSKIATLKDGLYERSRYSMIYYIDYFVMRILVSLMVPIPLHTAGLFSVILVVQLFSMHAKIFRIYRTKKLAFMSYMAELLVLVSILYSIFSFSKNDKDYKYLH